MRKIKEQVLRMIRRIKNPRMLIYSIVSATLIVVMLGCGGYLLFHHLVDAKSGDEFDELREIVNHTSEKDTGKDSEKDSEKDENKKNESWKDKFLEIGGSTDEEESFEVQYEVMNINGIDINIPIKNMDWEALHAINGDIYAWIYVPGTDVDYPVLQHPIENDYYLYKNLQGEYSQDGNIYTQVEYNSKDFTDYHTILYGHNRRSNGKMFRTLHNFQNRNFFDEYPYFFIYTEEGVYIYEIFAAYRTSNEHQIATYPIATYNGLLEYVEYAKVRSTHTGYTRDIPEDEQLGRIVTLSTCVGDDPSERLLVQAFLIYDPTQE